jgi:uncharacterized membrane protein
VREPIFFLHSVWIVLAAASTLSCSYRVEKGRAEPAPILAPPSPEALGRISYADVRPIFEAKCIPCHGSSGGINLETYEAARASLVTIRQAAVLDRRMPKAPYPPLTEAERAALDTWILAGGPMSPSGHPSESPNPPVTPAPHRPPVPRIPPAPGRVFYSQVRPIFQAKCVFCHGTSGGVNLESFEGARRSLGRIYQATIVQRRMPKLPYPPLTMRELSLLNGWIRTGGLNDPIPAPPERPPPLPLEPKYASIRENILAKKCLVCHSPGGKAERVPFVTKDDLLNSPLEIVSPGNAEESGLVLALSENARKKMPPPDSGMTGVTPEELAMIKDWINKGAKD